MVLTQLEIAPDKSRVDVDTLQTIYEPEKDCAPINLPAVLIVSSAQIVSSFGG